MSNGELARSVARIESMVRDGFETSHQRIDGLTEQVRTQNGRITTLERSTGIDGQKIVTLERDIRDIRRPASPVEASAGDSAPITRRDLQVAVFAIAALFAAIRWLPTLFTAAQGAP